MQPARNNVIRYFFEVWVRRHHLSPSIRATQYHPGLPTFKNPASSAWTRFHFFLLHINKIRAQSRGDEQPQHRGATLEFAVPAVANRTMVGVEKVQFSVSFILRMGATRVIANV